MIVDKMATRYGVLPSQILHLDVEDFNWNMLVFKLATEKEKTRSKIDQIFQKGLLGKGEL